MSKKQSNIKKEVEKKVSGEPFYTDILEEYFVDEDGVEKKKQTFMNKDKFVKEEIIKV